MCHDELAKWFSDNVIGFFEKPAFGYQGLTIDKVAALVFSYSIPIQTLSLMLSRRPKNASSFTLHPEPLE